MQLELLMRGARRTKSIRKDCRLPITPLILSRIYEVLNQHPDSYENKLLWAACCLGFFAFLRSSEFTLKQGECYDPTWHLSIKDVATDNLLKPTRLQIHIYIHRPSSSR